MKKLFMILKISLKGLLTNKVRSLLTILGIVIGIGSVIGLMSLGSGAQNSVESSISSLGTNIVTIFEGADGFGGDSSPASSFAFSEPLTEDDYDFLNNKNQFPEIAEVSPVISSSFLVKYGKEEEARSIFGVESNYEGMHNLNIEHGRFITESDISNSRNVAVVGSDISNQSDALGDKILVDGKNFSIIGTLEEQGSTGFVDPDTNIYLPYTTVGDKLLQTDRLSQLEFTVEDEDRINIAMNVVTEKLSDFRGVDPEEPDFTIFSSEQLIGTISEVTGIFTTLLAGIAAISLLVGGIGISNIMLVSVTERTKEIGLRKAVGARRRDILLQFLVEAVILTLLGGIIGILFGVALGVGVGQLLGFPANITLNSILLATGVSIGIGIIFGYVPASKASKLDPIDALRYE
ncbi:ABC transporter permease [Patescibacteria group bacterium]